MSTNTSQNLGLHLWEPNDQVLRTEFNQNWQKIDTAVAGARGKAYVIGSYTGNGGTQSIDLGFKPRFLHITGTICNYYNYRSTYQHEVATGGEQASEVVQLTDTGFTVIWTMGPNGVDELYPMVNRSGDAYSYIAFR